MLLDMFLVGYCRLLLPFPPEVFLYRGSHGTHQVVEVHHDVHPHVEEAAESCVPTSNEPGDCWIMLMLMLMLMPMLMLIMLTLYPTRQ